ncbi:hypothetical protein ABK040_012737 [Willaertia magna]
MVYHPRGRGGYHRGTGHRNNNRSSNNYQRRDDRNNNNQRSSRTQDDLVIQSVDGKREVVNKPLSLSERFSKYHEKSQSQNNRDFKPRGISKRYNNSYSNRGNSRPTRGGRDSRFNRNQSSNNRNEGRRDKKQTNLSKEDLDKELESYKASDSNGTTNGNEK